MLSAQHPQLWRAKVVIHDVNDLVGDTDKINEVLDDTVMGEIVQPTLHSKLAKDKEELANIHLARNEVYSEFIDRIDDSTRECDD